jgi:hypothetical protein
LEGEQLDIKDQSQTPIDICHWPHPTSTEEEANSSGWETQISHPGSGIKCSFCLFVLCKHGQVSSPLYALILSSVKWKSDGECPHRNISTEYL